MSSPFLPSPFTYGDLPQGGQLVPMVISSRIPSNTVDTQYAAGYFWLSSRDQFRLNALGQRVYGDGSIWIQSGSSGGHANWEQIVATLLTTLTQPVIPQVVQQVAQSIPSPIVPASTLKQSPESVTNSKPTAILNANIGFVTFTGFKTAPYGTQVFTISNNLISSNSQVMVSVDNDGSSDARITIQRVKKLDGSLQVYVTNSGTATLNGNVTILFQKLL